MFDLTKLLLFLLAILPSTRGFVPATVSVREAVTTTPRFARPVDEYDTASPVTAKNRRQALVQACLSTVLVTTLALALPHQDALAIEGAVGSNAKLMTGGASTLQSGRTISITRGVNLDGSDFSNQNLKGIAFQQSIVRDADFRNSNLKGASFFDATLDGSNFENA